jgi:hypothetical protein
MYVFLELDRPRGEADHSLLPSAEKSVDLLLQSLICLNGVHRRNLPSGLVQLMFFLELSGTTHQQNSHFKYNFKIQHLHLLFTYFVTEKITKLCSLFQSMGNFFQILLCVISLICSDVGNKRSYTFVISCVKTR